MERFTTAIRESVRAENWFAALFMSLAMPDICAQTERPSGKSAQDKGKKYRAWYKKYLDDKYVFPDGNGKPSGFTGADCWSFRCACLHSGLSAEARGRVSEFAFRPPVKDAGIIISCGMFEHQGKLTLQIDDFAENICKAVEQWETDMTGKLDVIKRINELIHIDDRHNQGFIVYE